MERKRVLYNPSESIDNLVKFFGKDNIKTVLDRFFRKYCQDIFLDSLEDKNGKFDDKDFQSKFINGFKSRMPIQELIDMLFNAIEEGNIELCKSIKIEVDARRNRNKHD